MTKSTKIYFIVIICAVALCLITGTITRNTYTGYTTFQQMEETENLQEYNVQIDDAEETDHFTINVKSYNDLEKTADLVVKVSTTDKRQLLPYAATKTEVIIEEVLKGKAKAGQHIFIYEPAHFSYSVSKRYKSTSGYQIMKEGEEYYLFLQKLKAPEGYKMSERQKNTYLPVTTLYSKFPVKKGDLKILDGKKLDDGEYNYGEVKNLEIITPKRKDLLQYKKFKKEVLEKFVSGKSNIYSNEYYSLILPENCNVQEDESNIYFVFNNKKIATITIEENFQYGDDVKTIVTNWLGMHSSIKSESLFLTDKSDVFHKVVVQNELSAAQEINGKEPEADEVHYFYLSEEKLFVDILLYENEHIALIENLIKSFSIK